MGITLNIEKCRFRTQELIHLEHKLSINGVKPDESKIKAIIEMPKPEHKKKGAKHKINLSEKLLCLIQKKKLLCLEQCLDIQKPIPLQIDACKTGVGAVLLQNEKPIAFASRSMTPAQLNYAIIEKEHLAALFGCERFHQFIYGGKVTVMKKSLTNTLPPLQKINDPDSTLSRAHTNETEEEIPEDEMIAQVHMVYANCSSSEENLKEVKTNTLKNITLNVVANYITNGWPQGKRKVEDSVKPYWSFKEEVTLIKTIIFKGQNILIPTSMRKATIQKLYLAHMGIEKTKMRARETEKQKTSLKTKEEVDWDVNLSDNESDMNE
ncbi:uncharacterized protein LOC124806064 [Hydra vulgaris]|uniref:uncharacterized protein LOC124806064 n=1 Tax=Hydra vulgaris TaxID=6087 RepID=UPI001F5E9996|nr:uncharacterized protein LOC124806064 [Hydra vulgaris]